MASKARRALKDRPYVSNYPQLHGWLQDIDARCMHQLPIGDKDDPVAYLEMYHARGSRPFVVLVYDKQGGWDVFTSPDTNKADETLADALARLNLKA